MDTKRSQLKAALIRQGGAEPPLAGRLSRLRWVTRRMITSVRKLQYLDSLGLAG